MTENEISKKIIGAAIELHKHLGPGLLESTYVVCPAYELRQQRLSAQTQITLPIVYKDVKLQAGYRITNNEWLF